MATAGFLIALLALIVAVAAYGKASRPYQIYVDVDGEGISYTYGNGEQQPDIEGPPSLH